MNKKFSGRTALAVLAVLFALSACGNKGDLYIPKEPKEKVTKEKGNSTTDNQAALATKTDAVP